MRLLVDDELFDVRYGELLEHERVLDLRAGVLRRSVHWRSPAGRRCGCASQRLVSLTQRGACGDPLRGRAGRRPGARRRAVRAGGQRGRAGEHGGRPPRRGRARAPAASRASADHDDLASRSRTARGSGLRLAAAMDHEIDGARGTRRPTREADRTSGRVTSPPTGARRSRCAS